MPTITTRTVEYLADGLTMIGHLALPAGIDRRPAVLLGPEGTGLSDVERRRADALAELGYVALAFDSDTSLASLKTASAQELAEAALNMTSVEWQQTYLR